jgi:hypothetical protein
VLLCAITTEARRSLTAQFTAKTAAAGAGAGPAPMAKSYRALVAGVVQQDQVRGGGRSCVCVQRVQLSVAAGWTLW